MKHVDWERGVKESETTAPHEDALYACRTETRRAMYLDPPVGWVEYTTFKGERVGPLVLLRHWDGGSLSVVQPNGTTHAIQANMLVDVEILYWGQA